MSGSALNPLRHLGALGFLCFWLLAASGIVLYAVLDTSVAGAYRSIAELSRQPWYLGGWLRSLHRYAADAFVVLMLAHLLREWLFGRYHGFRRFSWLTGVPLLLFAFVSAIGGFWLNWDRLGQFSAIATAEWLDALPFFASPLTRNFLGPASVGDRLFSLFVFIHVGVPLLLVFGLWFHIQRLSRAEVFPPRTLAAGVTLALLALALALPVADQGAADSRQRDSDRRARLVAAVRPPADVRQLGRRAVAAGRRDAAAAVRVALAATTCGARSGPGRP